jgi:hypothetical protein
MRASLVILGLLGVALMVAALLADLKHRHPRYEIPSIDRVPIPTPKPRQYSKAKAAVCVKWRMGQKRITPYLMVEVPVPGGRVPCHTLEGGSLSWYMNGKDL